TISYPRKGVTSKDVFNQETFDQLTTRIFEWQQGPGNFGGLCLHACWGETSVLARRYQGQYTSAYYSLIRGSMRLFQQTGNPRWKRLADDIASNLLFLQCADGGFRHACAEFEPCYHSGNTCPIHQGMPLLALLDYAAWDHADPVLKSMIRHAVDRHWEWFNKKWWMRGNGGQPVIRTGAGWCGVTNQDLVIVAVLASYGRMYGDFSRYNEWGKKVLDAYLSPHYYFESIGLFERGDSKDFNFVERTPYYGIILLMLERIISDLDGKEDKRLQAVIDNVSAHLFDAAFVATDGLTHLAWGAKTDPADKSRVLEWIKSPVTFGSYPELIRSMEKHLENHPDKEKQAIVENLKDTFAAYVFSDGGIPAALWPADPIISIVTASMGTFLSFWTMLIELLGDDLRDPAPVPARCYHRSIGELTWKSRGSLWTIEKNGVRVFGGYKPLSHGVTHGPEEKPAYGNYSDLDNCDIHEILTLS
ncbi:MAG: hypothetical protein FWH27_06145, partial [Planctomycetaceae bacterium]|nr:hypothetical protein [Planctomycetaceae bacterium]